MVPKRSNGPNNLIQAFFDAPIATPSSKKTSKQTMNSLIKGVLKTAKNETSIMTPKERETMKKTALEKHEWSDLTDDEKYWFYSQKDNWRREKNEATRGSVN